MLKTNLQTYKKWPPPQQLSKDIVFVFETDTVGTHTSLSGRYAMYGTTKKVLWKNNHNGVAPGTLGNWAVRNKFGVQEGTIGRSYGLVTTTASKQSLNSFDLENRVDKFLIDISDTFNKNSRFFLSITPLINSSGYSSSKIIRMLENYSLSNLYVLEDLIKDI